MHTKAEKTTAARGGLIELQNPSLGITLTGAIEISRFGLTPQPPIMMYSQQTAGIYFLFVVDWKAQFE